jgi:NADPH:quinone reductase-like Zn-dependent oxidoreductase
MQQAAVSTMKAIVVDEYGSPKNARLADVDTPKVKDDFLLVRMHAAAANWFDVKIVTGMVKDWMPVEFPYVLGMDGAGEVIDIGDGVRNWRKGDAVLAQFPRGAFAQYALISANDKKLARKPAALDFERAAAIPEAGLTAKTMVRAAGLKTGQTVLIIGATGGLGLFATQLAKAEGARVVATGKAEDEQYLRQLGADEVIDYAGGDVITQMVQRYPKGIDVVLDVINMGETLLRDAEVLRESGTLVSSLGGPGQDAFGKNVSVHYIQLTAQDGDLEDLASRAAEGKLRVEIGGTYDLAQAPLALVDLVDPAKHTRGKLVIRIP